ncbi:MAG: thiamine-phosphate kinase [Alphaproteobacteria bacterium]|nr:thiamine-phosphate kinase [Alphaproteobacteria bacterium]
MPVILAEMPDDPDEAYVIRTLTHRLSAPRPPTVGPGDDAAVLDDGLTLTVDAMVEGVHWDDRLSPEDVGAKLVAVNASDIAAMGASPRWALLALSLPDPLDRAWVEGFSRGLRRALDACGAELVGGDTTASRGARVASLSMGGALVGPPLLRSGARPGDQLWVSGTLGDAAGGFYLDPPPEELLAALRRPRPPLALGPALSREGLASAAMDVSDGLAADLAKLCEASGLGAEVEPERVPLSPALRAADPDALDHALGFGEDYQLLFTAPPERARRDPEPR